MPEYSVSTKKYIKFWKVLFMNLSQFFSIFCLKVQMNEKIVCMHVKQRFKYAIFWMRGFKHTAKIIQKKVKMNTTRESKRIYWDLKMRGTWWILQRNTDFHHFYETVPSSADTTRLDQVKSGILKKNCQSRGTSVRSTLFSNWILVIFLT